MLLSVIIIVLLHIITHVYFITMTEAEFHVLLCALLVLETSYTLFFPGRIPICNHCQCGDNSNVHVRHRGAAVYFMYQRVPDLYSVLHQPRSGFTDWRCITAPATNGKQDTGELKNPIFLIPLLQFETSRFLFDEAGVVVTLLSVGLCPVSRFARAHR